MYSAAMTLGVNHGEERLNNLYCMGDDAKINKAEILNWILWSHKYTSSIKSWFMISLKSWMFLLCEDPNIFACESFANFLTTYKSGREADRPTLDGEQDFEDCFMPRRSYSSRFVQTVLRKDTLCLNWHANNNVERMLFETSRTCLYLCIILLWMSVLILWSLSAIFHWWSLARVWQDSGGGNWLERATYRHYWKFRARSELNLTLPINMSYCSTNVKQ